MTGGDIIFSVDPNGPPAARLDVMKCALASVPEHGKAEIVRGEVVRRAPTGGLPGYAAEPAVPGWTFAVDELFPARG